MQNSGLTMEQFLASVEKRAFRMAQIATGSSEEALDLVQDSMFQLVRRYSDKPEEERRPLFFRILQNRIRDWHRKNTLINRWGGWFSLWGKHKDTDNPGDPLENVADPGGRNPADQAASTAALENLENALRSLPLRQQQAFLLRAWEEMSVRETAAAMNCSEGSVKTHYSRAVHTLREILEDPGS